MLDVLANSPLFAQIRKQEIAQMVSCLGGSCKQYVAGQTVLSGGDAVNRIGVVLAGQARSIKQDLSGKVVTVTLLQEGSYIGVLLAGSTNRTSPVSVQAVSPLRVIFFPIEKIISPCHRLCPAHHQLLRNYIAGISEKALVLHDRNDCLIKSTVREKIMTYLLRISKEQNLPAFTIPVDRAGMAEYLNVERSALSRELSAMQRDGLIKYRKNLFELCKDCFPVEEK